MAKDAESVAKALGEISRDHLECSICHERYQTPKILHRFHSFCEKCLLTYQESAQGPAVMKCPVCRQLSTLPPEGTEDLKTNFHLMEIVVDVALKEELTLKEGSKVMCELCEDERKAELRCMDCPLFLCKRCLGAHRRIAANHQVLTLDALRSNADSPKVRSEPPCDKHRGEKKRFFCETCDVLICRDCTIVEHRNHEFTTIDDAASRFRETTRELATKLEGNLSALQSKMSEKGFEDELDKSMSCAKETVVQHAKVAGDKVSQLESDVLEDISERKKLRSEAFSVTTHVLSNAGSFASLGNRQVYCKTTADKLETIDYTLKDWFEGLKYLSGKDSYVQNLLSQLEEEVQREAACDQTNIAARREELLSQVQRISDHRENLNKFLRAVIERMRHALATAGDIVKSASDGDFLRLHSVVDGDLQALLEESPLKLHPGYPEIEFKCTDGGLVGHLIGVPDASWKSVRQIVPSSDRVTLTQQATRYSPYHVDDENDDDDYYYYYDDDDDDSPCEYLQPSYVTPQGKGQVTITSLAAYSYDEILIGGQEGQALSLVIYDVAGTRTKDLETSRHKADKVATISDGSFITVQNGGNVAALYSPNATRQSGTFTLNRSGYSMMNSISTARYADEDIIYPISHTAEPYSVQQSGAFTLNRSGYNRNPISIARYTDKDIIVGFDSPNEVTVNKDITNIPLHSILPRTQIEPGFSAPVSNNISFPCSIQPDFLASTSKKWILLGARSPPSVEGLDSNGTSVLAIQPTMGGAPNGKQAECVGICTDNRDYIYVAVTVQGAREVHVHQYSPYGSFIACLTTDIAPPVSGIAVTGNDTLVVAEEHKLKIFQMDE